MGYLSAWAASIYPSRYNPIAKAVQGVNWQSFAGANPGPVTPGFNASIFTQPLLPWMGAIANGSISGAIAPGLQSLPANAPPTPEPGMTLCGHVTSMRGTGYWYIPDYVSTVPGMSPVGVITTRMPPLASSQKLIQYLFPPGG